MDLLQMALQLAQKTFDSLQGSPAEAQAKQDLDELQALAASRAKEAEAFALAHAKAAAQDVEEWWARVRHGALLGQG